MLKYNQTYFDNFAVRWLQIFKVCLAIFFINGRVKCMKGLSAASTSMNVKTLLICS